MKSLTDLNNKATNDLQEFTDERAGKVIWDRTQYDAVFDITQDENDYIGLNIPLRVLEIVNYQQTQLKLEIDVSQTTGEIQFEKSWPSWATVSEVNRVVTISGFRHINDFNEIYDLDQRFRLAGYFGNTDTIELRFYYLIQSTEYSRPWTLDLDITEVLNMTSPPASVFYSIQNSDDPLISISVPTVLDAGGLGVDFRMIVSASVAGVLNTISIPQTSGATTVIDTNNKTVTIEGNTTQINTELAGLLIRFNESEVDFDLEFELTDVFEDSSAGIVSDIKTTRYKTITTDLNINRQWVYDDTGTNPDVEKPFLDARFAINAESGISMTISVPENAFRYYTDIDNKIYSLDTTSVVLSGLTVDELETVVHNLRYIAPQTYAGDPVFVFTISSGGSAIMNQYEYNMEGNYVVWTGTGDGVGALNVFNITEGDELNSTDYPDFVWGGGGQGTQDIVAINNGSEANFVITWDLAYSTAQGYNDMTDWQLHWDNIPSGVSVTRTTNNKYRVVGIDSVADWETMRIPSRVTMPNDASGEFAALGTITYTPDRTKLMDMFFEVDAQREFGIVADWPKSDDNTTSDVRAGQTGYSVAFYNYTRGYTGGVLPTVTVVDIGQTDPVYTVTVAPDKPDSVDDINSAGSGGTVLFNDANKTLTVIGTKSVVNNHLANLTIDLNIGSMEHGWLRYAVSNNVNSESDECAVYLGGSQYDPVFSYDCSTISSDVNQYNNFIDGAFEISTSDMELEGTTPQPGDSLVLSLYNTTYLTSVTMAKNIYFDQNFGYENSYSDHNGVYELHPFRHPVIWSLNYIAPNAYDFFQGHNNDNTVEYITPYDEYAFWQEFQPHNGYIDVRQAYTTTSAEDQQTSRIYHQTSIGPKVAYRTDTNEYTGYGTLTGPYIDPDKSLKFGVSEDVGSLSPTDGNGWIIRHEPNHFGHCITTNSDVSRIGISHSGEVYTNGAYGDRYYYGFEYDGQPGVVGTNLIGAYGTEWGDYGAIATDLQRDTLGKSNYTTQYSNDYRATHTGVVYIYDNSTNFYTNFNDSGIDYAKPIQKIYPPVSDGVGDELAAPGNHLLFGEYHTMSLDGERLAITCPGWQSGSVDGVNLKGVYTYTWNSITEQYDFDAVLGQTALVDPQWDSTGNLLVGADRDDNTKLRIYSRNSNGSLSLIETLPIQSTHINSWDFSPISRTIVIANTDGTLDVYEINNNTLDYSKTQEFAKGASESRGEVQISTDGLMTVWKVQDFANSDDSGDDWNGYGQFVIFRDSISEEFFSGLNNNIGGVTVVNGKEHPNALDIAGWIARTNWQYYPYTNNTDHKSYFGAVFPLGNRTTWDAAYAPPNAGGISGNTATIVWQPSAGYKDFGTDTVVRFNINSAAMGDYDKAELRLIYTPADSSQTVTRNKAYYASSPFPYTDITYIPYYDLGPVYSEGEIPAWSNGYLSGGTPGNT